MIAITYRVTPKSAGKWQRALGDRYVETVERGLRRAGRWAVQSIELRTANKGKVDTRDMIDSFWPRVRDGKLTIYNTAPHHKWVELGRKPGTMPPVRAISAWAGRKLGNPRLGWPIALKIKREGIKPTPLLSSPAYGHKLKEICDREVHKALEVARRSIRGT